MRKFNEPCIKTGDFAKLCNTNKRTLFHYDEIGLFSPAYTDAKGYRYYTESQCDVFFTINCLKELGMPLKEIKKYVDHRNPSDLKRLLEEQKGKVDRELEHLKRMEHVIQTKLELITIGEKIQFDGRLSEVTLEDHPREYFIATERLDTDDHGRLFHAICRHISYCNHEQLNTGHPYGAILDVACLKAGKTDIYAHFVTKVAEPPRQCGYLVKPEGEYAVVYLRGNYYEAEEAYERLFCYIERHGLTPGEFCYKEAIWDEMAVRSEEDYLTKISIPVKRP